MGLGKIDIIIPHYNVNIELIDRLIDSLSIQTIIQDCVIYFISDCSEKDAEFLNYIKKQKLLNIVLLKTPQRGGPGVARNYGIDHSYNKYLLFFDADDYFINPKALEELYLKAEEGHDAVQFMMYNYHNNKTCLMVKRELLIENDIKYAPLFFGEDMNFSFQVEHEATSFFNYHNTENIFAYYDIDVATSLTNTFGRNDPHHLNFITSRFMIIQKGYATFNVIKGFYDFIEFNRDILTNNLAKVYIYYILYITYLKYPDLYFTACANDGRANDFINNSLYVTLDNTILTSEEDIIKYLKENLQNINDPFLRPAAQESLALLP